MGPRTGSDGCGKSRPPPGFDPQAFQSVAVPTDSSCHKLRVITCTKGITDTMSIDQRTNRHRAVRTETPVGLQTERERGGGLL